MTAGHAQAFSQTDRSSANATLLIETVIGRIEPRSVAEETIIGRDPRCAISIDHPTVSRMHARVYREGVSWRFQDLGSQNGSMLNDAPSRESEPLTEGAELRIGRVRAWFFAGEIPDCWKPSDAGELSGKLVRCRCGHIGWAPAFARGMTLTCAACGRDIVINDGRRAAAAAPVAATAGQILGDCAACHTPIAGSDRMHTCGECAVQMHADCWRENRGCATYGCGQVNVLDGDAAKEPEQAEAAPASFPAAAAAPAPPRAASTSMSEARADELRYALAQLGLFTLASLPTFGIPGIAFAAYRLVAGDTNEEGPRRYAWIALSFAGGVIGFATSMYWWFGV